MSEAKPIALVDTDVVSNLLKATTIGCEYARLLHAYQAAIAFITAGELQAGALRRRLGARRQLHLDQWLVEYPIIRFKSGMELIYAQVMVERERMGKRMERSDAWIAATALHYDIPLVTHDSDYVGTRGLRIITASEEVRAAQLRLPPVVSGRPLSLDASCRCGL
jgi:tRNA(fMet)-specific endonuclease VapC